MEDNPKRVQELVVQMEALMVLKETEVQRVVEVLQVQVTQLRGEDQRLSRL